MRSMLARFSIRIMFRFSMCSIRPYTGDGKLIVTSRIPCSRVGKCSFHDARSEVPEKMLFAPNSLFVLERQDMIEPLDVPLEYTMVTTSVLQSSLVIATLTSLPVQ